MLIKPHLRAVRSNAVRKPTIASRDDFLDPLERAPLTVSDTAAFGIISRARMPTGFTVALVSFTLNVPVALMLRPAGKRHLHPAQGVSLVIGKAKALKLLEEADKPLLF